MKIIVGAENQHCGGKISIFQADLPNINIYRLFDTSLWGETLIIVGAVRQIIVISPQQEHHCGGAAPAPPPPTEIVPAPRTPNLYSKIQYILFCCEF